MREALKDLEKRGLLSLDDAAVIIKDTDGKFKVHGQADRGVKIGAVGGGLMGLLLASIFFPIGGIVLGVLAGAGIGAAANIGIDKKFVKDVEAAMPNSSSAIIIYARSGDPSAVRARAGAVQRHDLSDQPGRRRRRGAAPGAGRIASYPHRFVVEEATEARQPMTYGPIDILAIEFPDNTKLLGEGLAELIELVANGTIRIIDLLVVMKDADGNVAARELQELDPALIAVLDPLQPTVTSLVTMNDVEAHRRSAGAQHDGGHHALREPVGDQVQGGAAQGRRPAWSCRSASRSEVIVEELADIAVLASEAELTATAECEHHIPEEGYMLRMRRRGVARAVGGTAAMVGTAGAVHHHQEQRWANQDAQQQAQYAAPQQQYAPRLRRPRRPRRPATT